MAYVSIDPTEIEAGDATKQELWNKTRLNLDDHEDRIGVLEQTSLKYAPIGWDVFGDYSETGARTDDMGFAIVEFDIVLIGAVLLIHHAGTSGTTRIDVKYKRGAGSWTSVFDSPANTPSVGFGAGDYAKSTGGVLDDTHKYLQAGDILKLETLDRQGGEPDGFSVFLSYAADV